MAIECEVDGSYFVFPEGWELEKLDDWPEQNTLNSAPFHSKGCDLVALHQDELWLVEAKDYTYSGARPPSDLAQQVGLKMFHSLAILHSVAKWGTGPKRQFSAKALAASNTKLCLAVELPDGGRKLQTIARPLADLRAALKGVTRKLNEFHPVVSNSMTGVLVPWQVRRDPDKRLNHRDR